MENKTKSLVAKYRQVTHRTRKIVAVLTLIVMIGTVLMPAQPAFSMTNKIICKMEEHTHIDACYEMQSICGQDESEEHTHTEECWQKNLVCTLPEHTHVAECYTHTDAEIESPSEDKAEGQIVEDFPEAPSAEHLPKDIPEKYTDVYDAKIPGGGIRVYAQPDTIPKDVELNVRLLDESSTEFAQAVERLKSAGNHYDFIKALDISFINQQGEEIEPLAPVYISIDVGTLLPEEANPRSIQIQHHKELVPLTDKDRDKDGIQDEIYTVQEPNVRMESVVDNHKGVLEQDTEAGSWVAIFPVDSFSIFTITSSGWSQLNIQVQCVDEYALELEEGKKPNNIIKDEMHKPDATFDITFMTNEHERIKIDGYQYDGKAYYMQGGQYKHRIYGLRRENGKWYYYPNDNNRNAKTEFDPQPDFYGENPKDFIRLVYKKVMKIPVQYVHYDDKKNEIVSLPQEATPNGRNPDYITNLGNEFFIRDVDSIPKINTYFYIGKAFIGEAVPKNEVLTVISKEGQIYGVTPDEKEIPLTEDNPLKVLYSKTQTGRPDTIRTVPTRDKGLVINLFDYDSGERSGEDEKINAGKKLQFVQDRSREQEYNRWTGMDGGIYTGIVEEELVDGYPVVDGQSLNYLFDPDIGRAELGKTVKHVHTNLDHLFTVDKDGYYTYDSMRNFATVMDPSTPGGEPPHYPGQNDGGNFVVYKQPALPGQFGEGDNPKFLPFNKYSEANRPNKPHNQETIKQYHFGMTMEADFIMPIGGQVADEDGSFTGLRDMVFQFNGDDDVWFFIDGKLVLDLGGIHDRYGGMINFRTGEVRTNAPSMEHSGRVQKNLYNIQGDPNELTYNQLAEARENAGFGKFSKHRFKFFYLERGKGASNCEISFNMIPVVHTLVIGKRLPEHLHVAPVDHMWYQFQVETEQPGGNRKPLANTTYDVIKLEPDSDPIIGGEFVRGGKTDNDGYFYLRAGERAVFRDDIDLKDTGITETSKVKIFVSEIIRNDQGKPSVAAWSGKEESPGTYLTVTDNTGKTRNLVPPLYDSLGNTFHVSETQTNLAESHSASNGESAYQAVLTSGRINAFNWIDFENDLSKELASLKITKKALRTVENTPISGVSFNMKIELWDERNQVWIPLSEDSPYWILNEGESAPEANKEPELLAKDADGQIAIEHGQTIYMKLIAGTKYRVSEVLSAENEKLYTTTYTGTVENPEGEKEQLVIDKESDRQMGIGNKTGVKAGSTHNITITNYNNVGSKGAFVLTKNLVAPLPTAENSKFPFYLGINDYDISKDSQIECKAIYYNTPKNEVRPQAQKEDNVWVENITFKPDMTDKMAGNLFLYPGETVVITGLPEGYSMYVRENLTQEQKEEYDVTFREEGKNTVSGNEITSTAAQIDKNGVVKVTCTNTSKLQSLNTLYITKTVKRTDQPNGTPTDADRKKEFPFRITLKNPTDFVSTQVQAGIQTDSGNTTSKTLHFTQYGADYVAEISLKHGETLILYGLPINIDVVVQEINHKGYVVSMNEVLVDNITIHLKQGGESYSVVCVNTTSGVTTPDGNTSGGNTPDGNTPDGNTPDGNTPDGNTSGGNTPDGNTPDGNTPDGNTSDGNTPDGNTSDPNISDGNIMDNQASQHIDKDVKQELAAKKSNASPIISDSKLPQTGMAKRPILVLAIMGLFLLVTGYRLAMKKD